MGVITCAMVLCPNEAGKGCIAYGKAYCKQHWASWAQSNEHKAAAKFKGNPRHFFDDWARRTYAEESHLRALMTQPSPAAVEQAAKVVVLPVAKLKNGAVKGAVQVDADIWGKP